MVQVIICQLLRPPPPHSSSLLRFFRLKFNLLADCGLHVKTHRRLKPRPLQAPSQSEGCRGGFLEVGPCAGWQEPPWTLLGSSSSPAAFTSVCSDPEWDHASGSTKLLHIALISESLTHTHTRQAWSLTHTHTRQAWSLTHTHVYLKRLSFVRY